MSKVFVTRKIPQAGITLLEQAGHEVTVSTKDGVLTRDELKTALAAEPYDALLSLLTDPIDADILAAAPHLKVVANYAVGYNNINLSDAQTRGIVVTNTPGVLTDTVAEFTVALILAVTKRIPEADVFTRAGHYTGWAPELYLGTDIKGKTLGIVGGGRIGSGVAERMQKGFGMEVIYTDVKPCEPFEAAVHCHFEASLEVLLAKADIVSIHVPLLPTTHHLINAERLALMKPTAYLINTARGPIIDETALVSALQNGVIRGAGLDVFEAEPSLAEGLDKLTNVVVTPHIASASTETRTLMSEIAARNIIAVLSGAPAINPVTP